LQQQAVGDGNFDTLLNALATYLSGAQVQRLNKALELAELLRSARQILPKIGGVVGI
jgi:ABC-type transporter Mla subunit MlaD